MTVTTQRRGPFGHPLGAANPTSPSDVAAISAEVAAAQRRWAETTAHERGRVLLRLHDQVLARRSEILDLVQCEGGKSRGDAFEEVADVAGVARHYARKTANYLAPQRFRGFVPALIGTVVERSPVGVVGVIAPWNYPLILTLGEIIPALAAGNGVVVKPDPLVVDTCRLALDLLAEAGVPAGLVRMVEGGPDVGEAVVDAVDHIVFTGSTNAGRAVAARAGERLIGATLELGGKNTAYVRHDADLRLAVTGTVKCAFGNAGQLCLSAERLIVHEKVAARFIDAFCQRTAALRLGNTLTFDYDLGSQISAAQFDKVRAHVSDARESGATVLVGGGARPDLGPYVHEPTVVTDLPAEAVSYSAETFGPLVALSVVDSDAKALALANDTEAGLTASIWTRDTRAGRTLARRMRVGSVSINDTYQSVWGSTAVPFGGVGASGLGRRHGPDGLQSLTRTQTIVTQRGARLGIDVAALLSSPSERDVGAICALLAGMRRAGLS